MAKYPPLRYEQMNEADVREEVIAPLLRELGYQSGTKHDVIREQSLRYPRAFLGRKDSRKDPELRGKADYILEVDNAVRWVLEAKSPRDEIQIDDIEQAWTYANHPEIRAVYFALCNGQTFQVFQTPNAPQADPILVVPYENLEESLTRLRGLIGAEELLREFPRRQIDTSPPIGPGLRSFVRITNGLVRYDWNSLGSKILNELLLTIADGAVERDEQGELVAFLRTTAPFRSVQELNERLGIASFEMTSKDGELSVDPSHPTQFMYSNTVILPAGEHVMDFANWRPVVLPRNLTCKVVAVAEGVLEQQIFSGKFRSHMDYLEFGIKVDLTGSFRMHLL